MFNLNRFSFEKFGLFTFAALLGALTVSTAHAGQGRIGLLWSPSYTMTQTSGAATSAPAGAFSPVGGGLGLTYMFGSKIGIELEGFYLQRGLSSTQTNNAYSVDTLLRFEPVRFLSFGGGIYFDAFSSGTAPTVSGRRVADSDYGIKVGGGLRLPLGARISLLTEAFYKLGLNNQTSVSGANFSYSMIQGIVGLEFHGAAGK